MLQTVDRMTKHKRALLEDVNARDTPTWRSIVFLLDKCSFMVLQTGDFEPHFEIINHVAWKKRDIPRTIN